MRHVTLDTTWRRFEAWVFSSSADDLMGDIVNDDDNECVDATAATWELLQVHMSLLNMSLLLHRDPVICAG